MCVTLYSSVDLMHVFTTNECLFHDALFSNFLFKSPTFELQWLYYPQELTEEFAHISVSNYLDFNRRNLLAVIKMLQASHSDSTGMTLQSDGWYSGFIFHSEIT